jgi:hypothetical protein
LLFGGTHVLRNHPFIARLIPRLITQLVPAALVTIVGVTLLGNLAKAPDTAPAAAPVPTAIHAEAVFKMTPREPAETDEQTATAAASRTAAKPKALAVSIPTPPRKPADESATARQIASAPAPLSIVPIPAQPQAAAASNPTVLGRVWGATTAVAGMPYRAALSVTGWFAAETPPRPPAPVPLQNFQAAM